MGVGKVARGGGSEKIGCGMARPRSGVYLEMVKMRIFSKSVVLVIAVAGLAGCQSSPQKRIAKNEEAFAAMPVEAQAAIRAGRVEVGFTPVQVEMAKGKADRVGRRTTATGEQLTWIYEKGSSGLGFGLGIGGGSGGLGGGVGVSTGGRGPSLDYVVVFTDGVVSSVEDYSGK